MDLLHNPWPVEQLPRCRLFHGGPPPFGGEMREAVEFRLKTRMEASSSCYIPP